MSHFLFINQFYPPDLAPTGQMLHGFVRQCVSQGHQVTVICSNGSYEGGARYESGAGAFGETVIRVGASAMGRRSFAAKLLDYTTFYASLNRKLSSLADKPDLVMALTTPPYIGWLAQRYARRHAIPHAHWVMDLYPDVLAAHGMVGKDGAPYRWLARLTANTFSDAAAVFALGPDMEHRIQESYHLRKESLHSIPLWYAGDTECAKPGDVAKLRQSRGWSDDLPVFLYAGNMGVGHCFDEFFEVIKTQGEDAPRWIFSGGGKRRREVEAFHGSRPDLPLELCPYVARDELTAHLMSAQVHLASLRPGWEGTMVPSKIAASFKLGKPVLFVGPENSSPAIWIRESGGGWVVPPGAVGTLKRSVAEALDRDEAVRRGNLANAFSTQFFDCEINTQRMLSFL